MTTVILVGLIVVLLAAAAYVGVLLVRRTRSARAAAEPVGEQPRTVADLVKRRVAPADAAAAEISGDELFVPAVPRQDGVAVPAPDGTAPDDTAARPAAAPSLPPATPAGGLEVGDAPWRRAARMTGAEPGGTWETAPIPVAPEVRTDEMKVPAPDGATDGAMDGATTSVSSSVVIVSRAAPTAASLWTELEAMRAAAARPEPVASEQVDEPSPWTEPVEPSTSADFDPLPTPRTDLSEPVAVETEAAPVSRPLSDPDLTPLMGIPIIRPAAAEVDVPVAVPDAAPEVLDEPADDPVGAPVPRVTTAPVDDDVVFLVPPTSSFPVVAPAVPGSPQPVWFRVVRRDGEPVPAAVVALLDGHGREVDTTKTAADGGGELHAPHAGKFLMIVSADGYQPRATLLTVDAEPVELALLLPRSAAVSGSVRAGNDTVRDARVVVRQDHDVVDEALTAGDGHYRFDDLAEGSYTLAATGGPGGATARVSLAEGSDVQVDLDLR